MSAFEECIYFSRPQLRNFLRDSSSKVRPVTGRAILASCEQFFSCRRLNVKLCEWVGRRQPKRPCDSSRLHHEIPAQRMVDLAVCNISPPTKASRDVV